ncbi:MAG: GNAT family N-acetyltransferase [Planctomycetes bacterium]|nr:GNAT family N-acetyltransferase [Planctomycetota bacterium]
MNQNSYFLADDEKGLTLNELNRRPKQASEQVTLGVRDNYCLRLLRPEDEVPLFEYFRRLGPETRSRYAPHPFDREAAVKICQEIDYLTDARIVAVAEDADGRIDGYFIVHWGVAENERQRFSEYGIKLCPALTCMVAPSVADEQQGQGLGSAMMAHVFDLARRVMRLTVVLQGGVQASNTVARNFYAKFGFRNVGIFEAANRQNYDMMVELR